MPKVKLKESKIWLFILGGLVSVIGIGWGLTWLPIRNSASSSLVTPTQVPATPVKLTTLQTETVQKATVVLGRLEASSNVVLKPEIDGRIAQILIQEGDLIQRGQPLFTLNSDDLQAELLQAKAILSRQTAKLAELEAGSRVEDLAEARARLKEAQTRLANVQQGSSIEEIAQAQAEVESNQAQAELAKQRVERYRLLEQEGAVSTDQFEEIKTQQSTAIAALERARRHLAELKQSRNSDVTELEATVEQAQQNLRRLENGARSEVIAQARADVAEASANVSRLEVKWKKATIKAPIDGQIGYIPVKIGEYVESGDTLTTITENNLLELNLSIPLESAYDLRLGLPVEILDGENQIIARGEISFIAPNVTADSQLVLAKAVFPNLDRKLLNRQFIQARVIWQENQGILVPASAVSRLGGQAFVFVAKKAELETNGENQLIVEQRLIKLGDIQGNSYQILDGLKPGERIVTAGILQLQDGKPIQELTSQ